MLNLGSKFKVRRT